MNKLVIMATALVFLTALLATGNGVIHSVHACPNNPNVPSGLNTSPNTSGSPSTQIAQSTQPLQSQSV
ncbi:MAG TPA: hypothetical protein VH796_06935 [Nitrososphaeraceae archaeon]